MLNTGKGNDSPFSNKFIFDIYKDSDGDMWIGGVVEDIVCYSTKNDTYRFYGTQPISSMTELSPGKMLLACSYGLLLLDKANGNIEILLGGYLARDILVKDNAIWLTTCGDGLIRYDRVTKQSEIFTTQTGLLSNYINSILEADGYFWLGTEHGLCRFDPETNTVLTYSSVYSLSNVSFNVKSCYKLRNGDLIWGTNDGAVMFDPAKLYFIHPPGRIFIQDIKIAGRSIREYAKIHLDNPLDKLQVIKLEYNQNNLALELLPIGISPVGSRFSWKMDGVDTDWSLPSNYQVLTYSNIPSGKFKLHIRMYDNSMSQIIDERTLDIDIIPPIWQRWWFRLIIIVLLGSILYFSLNFYINRLKQRHAEDKIRFFTNTAHDIRTSLTLIKAPIEELHTENMLTETGQYYLQLATEQARRLSSVATQLLDFQKADIGKGQLSLRMVDLIKLVKRRKSMFEASANSQNIKLLFSSNKDVYYTAIDESKIEKVIDNLISNAIKYSKPDTEVQISLNCNVENWIFEIKDEGIGISKKAQKKLFREFYRSDNAVNSKIVGSGIGLLLVKNYVSLHDGDISLSSQENAGSTFQIIIPYRGVDAEEEKLSEKVNENLLTSSMIDISMQTPAEEKKLPEHEVTILIVEDNIDLQNFLRFSLQNKFKVEIAGDGVEAWALIEKKIPDLIVSDIMMPNMDGFELCRLIKSTFETSHIPVILLTALSEKTKQLEGLGLGADDYITKPFDMALLLQRIKTIILNREVIREKALKLIKRNEDTPVLSNELNDKFLKKAIEVVNNNISNSEFGKDEFASALNASPSLLYKKLKSLTNQSPVDFIKTIRMNHALELLQSHKYNVTEVSELCGFSSVGYFSTTFKRHFGKSPTEV